MSNWDSWIGRAKLQRESFDLAQAERWSATFDLDCPTIGMMPQGIHLCLCTPDAKLSQLGEDGHPARDASDGSFFPPIPLPRRMWAASDMEFLEAIPVGADIERTSTIMSVTEKEGKSGKLGFVEVEHVTKADALVAVRETQTLVYRDALAVNAALTPPEPSDASFEPAGWEAHQIITPDPRLLFRFSALTFNTHRIHYDLPYARNVERYRGLVVHGPLMASLLLQLAARELGENKLRGFSFRAISPAIADEPLHLAMRGGDDGYELGAFASDGRQCVKASATL